MLPEKVFKVIKSVTLKVKLIGHRKSFKGEIK